MATREYEFINGNESSVSPNAAEILTSKFYDLSFSSETQKDQDISASGMNAQKSVGFLLDASDDYRQISVQVYPTSTTNIRVVSEISLTGTYRLIILGVQ